MRHDHPELRRNHVEPLRGLLANHMHGRTTAGAVGVFRRDRHIDARQMGGKRTAIDAALVAARPCGHGVLFVVGGLVAGNGLLDILEAWADPGYRGGRVVFAPTLCTAGVDKNPQPAPVVCRLGAGKV
jgi:hypothetical protein